MQRIKTTEARGQFGAIVDQVAYGKEHVIVHRRGKDLAAIIPMDEFKLLEEYMAQLADEADPKAADATPKAPDTAAPFSQVMEELGLNDLLRGDAKLQKAPPRKAPGRKPAASQTKARQGRNTRSPRRAPSRPAAR